MQEKHITVTKTARYFVLGNIHGKLRQVWFVCHGYGQLATYFIRHFQVLENDKRLIVAPEAFSRHYLNGFSGKVGASWMTREDRLQEIEDYVNYLDALYDEIFKHVERSAVRVFILGFSQGTATASRWIDEGNVKADRLILWSGLLPPDFNLETDRKILQQLELCLVVGTKDEYLKPHLLSDQEAKLIEYKIPYRLITFEGKHQLNSEVLRELAES